MLARRRFISCAICSLAGFAATQVGGTQAMAQGQSAPAAAPAGISRKVLGRTDMPGDKYVAILMEAEFDGGLKVARHTHPGVESTYLMAGGGVLSVKGQPDRTLAPGDGFQIPPEVPHAFQVGGDKTKLVITYIVEKDKPLATPAPE
ncbi:cupin domain-containing protein [Xanthobacter aminoxidans]|uniref:Cupin domain-containing protein n=1 Tax=Xanthobacter aminoxidans TaxID=186280 RepID=A0ABW6ZDU4_9HYPH